VLGGSLVPLLLGQSYRALQRRRWRLHRGGLAAAEAGIGDS
jgi:hypothetical protein